MRALAGELRRELERAVIEARDVAEAGARAALEALAVHHYQPYSHMSPEERVLRNRIRAHAKQLGDVENSRKELQLNHVVHECAYEHWHRMLFARFLAENDLLIEPESGVAVSLEECEELAREAGTDLWTMASRFAQAMLPQIFRPDEPVLQIALPREYRTRLEGLVEGLRREVFLADDSLGWVYQFWQTKKKDEVNRSEVKIGADELPAVTQLFTEHYMVQFLLDNSLGAWWFSRYPGQECPIELTYLRILEDGKPAVGTFDGWPKRLADLKMLDPCMGSGHFLIATFLMLVPMRMKEEGLTARDACDAVIQDNIHGLEIDSRCTEIAAFALALVTWTYPDAGGYRPLPEMHLACCGLPVSASEEEWVAFSNGDKRFQEGMAILYKLFSDGPTLGSLINQRRFMQADLVTAGYDELKPLLDRALEWEKTRDNAEQFEIGVTAKGLAKAAALLGETYHLIATNVPYLARGRQAERLKSFCETYYPTAKNDLATVFLERCLEFCKSGSSASLVLPQNWLFLTSYRAFREKLLQKDNLRMIARIGEHGFDSSAAAGAFTALLIARLGSGAFDTISGEIVKAICMNISKIKRGPSYIVGLDVAKFSDIKSKAAGLRRNQLYRAELSGLLNDPDFRISFIERQEGGKLEEVAECYQGIVTGDIERFTRKHWEIDGRDRAWVPFRRSNNAESPYGDVSDVLFWEGGQGDLHSYAAEARSQLHDMHESGNRAWGRHGVAINRMRDLRAVPYFGEHFDNNVAVVFPREDDYILPSLLVYFESDEFARGVRDLDQSLKVTNRTLLKVQVDLEHWGRIAWARYPHGFPKPFSDDSTQWIFHGHPSGSVIWDEEKKQTALGRLRVDATVLQVAVARLLGYRWPAETDSSMELSSEARKWIDRCKELDQYSESSGIACIPSVRGQEPASEKLRALLTAAYGNGWVPGKERELLRATGSTAEDIDGWLRSDFFEQHCKLFHHRPFIWHIWDGRNRDGFHVLVNYHKLCEGEGKGRKLLETIAYAYLGDWISRQQDGVRTGAEGAEGRLAAAHALQSRLSAIIEGNPPFDIFVRWKPLLEQPIGWEPDINDGVRLNIHPFMALDLPNGRAGAGVLRWKPNIKWGKDRGNEPERPRDQFPWFWADRAFTGERVNDIHLDIAAKVQAREILTKGGR